MSERILNSTTSQKQNSHIGTAITAFIAGLMTFLLILANSCLLAFLRTAGRQYSNSCQNIVVILAGLIAAGMLLALSCGFSALKSVSYRNLAVAGLTLALFGSSLGSLVYYLAVMSMK